MNNAQNHPQRSVVLEASHVVKSYREGTSALPVLKDVNLRIHAGEAVAVLGASGSGSQRSCMYWAVLTVWMPDEWPLPARTSPRLKESELDRLRNRPRVRLSVSPPAAGVFRFGKCGYAAFIRRLPKREALSELSRLWKPWVWAGVRASAFAAFGRRTSAYSYCACIGDAARMRAGG